MHKNNTIMTHYDIKRLALVLAAQAEIEGMKAFNLIRETNGMVIGYDEQAFAAKAEELRNLATMHDEQL